MKVAVLGAGGGLGRNVVDAALVAGHEVVALVRDPRRAALPPEVTTVIGDAARPADVARASDGADATMCCVNPPFAAWLTAFPPLLAAAIEGVRRTGARFVFPANVWIYGRGRPGELVDERRAPSPISKRGKLRAAMEQQLRDAGIRHAMVRLPEFYGPSVTTLTPRVFRAALAGKRATWPGHLDVPIELVFMPDAARALVTVGLATDCDGEVFHLPGARTTARGFAEAVFAAAGTKPRISGVPPWLLSVIGMFDGKVRGAADVAHLWVDPILLDGSKYVARFGAVPSTPLADALALTLAWTAQSL